MALAAIVLAMASARDRSWAVGYLVGAVALVGLSALPWFRTRVDGDAPFPLAHHVNAWSGSTLWTFSVLAGVAAAILGVAATLKSDHASARLGLYSGLVAVVFSIGLWARQWWLINNPPGIHGVAITKALTSAEEQKFVRSDPYRIQRDQLASYANRDRLGFHAWITDWSYAATALLIGLAFVIMIQAVAARRSSTDLQASA
jgi:hypothetical protein